MVVIPFVGNTRRNNSHKGGMSDMPPFKLRRQMQDTIRARKNKGKIYKKTSERSLKAMKDNKFTVYKEINKPTMDRVKQAALEASDNGRCWWVYQHIISVHTYDSTMLNRR